MSRCLKSLYIKFSCDDPEVKIYNAELILNFAVAKFNVNFGVVWSNEMSSKLLDNTFYQKFGCIDGRYPLINNNFQLEKAHNKYVQDVFCYFQAYVFNHLRLFLRLRN